MTTENKKKTYPWVREKILINPQFQLRMVAYAAVLATICVGFLYLADLYFFYKLDIAAKITGLNKNYDFSIFTIQQREMRTKVFCAVAFIDFTLLIVAGIFISHRIAGPIFKICRGLDRLSDHGDAPEVVFRKKDFFPELSNSFNKLRTLHTERPKKLPKRAA